MLRDEYHLTSSRSPSSSERWLAGLHLDGASTEPASGPHATTVLLPADAPPPDPALPVSPDVPPAPAPAASKKRQAGVLPTDSMATATRKVLRLHYEAMRDHEEGTISGEDPEGLHDMRVATRRMRAALRIAEPYLSGKAVARVGRDLRQVARALGAVRDLDVLIEHARQFRYELPAEQQADMDGLLAVWEAARKRARRKLLRLLEFGRL